MALPLCGWVLTAWGWEAVFYVSGALALIWTVAWWFLVFDSPDQHPRISDKEREYLAQHLEPIKEEVGCRANGKRHEAERRARRGRELKD